MIKINFIPVAPPTHYIKMLPSSNVCRLYMDCELYTMYEYFFVLHHVQEINSIDVGLAIVLPCSSQYYNGEFKGKYL